MNFSFLLFCKFIIFCLYFFLFLLLFNCKNSILDEDLTEYQAKVTFLPEGEQKAPFFVIVNKGEKLKKPNNPVKENYIFQGWYKESNFKNQFNFDNEIISQDITLYAKWQKKTSQKETVDVTFRVENYGEISIFPLFFSFVKGSKVTRKPNDPAKEGYTFQGWYKESTFQNKFNFDNETVNQNITLYGKLQRNQEETPNEENPPQIDNPGYTFGQYVAEKSFVVGNTTTHPFGIIFHENKFYITSNDKDKLLVFNKQGALLTGEGFPIDVDDGILYHAMVRVNGLFYIMKAKLASKHLLVYSSSGERQGAKEFNLLNNIEGICFYNNFFYMTDSVNTEIIAYNQDGTRNSSEDFSIVDTDFGDNIRGIVAANGKFFIIVKEGFLSSSCYVQVYENGTKIKQFNLHNDNLNPWDITYHNGFVYITDKFRTSSKVYAYFVN